MVAPLLRKCTRTRKAYSTDVMGVHLHREIRGLTYMTSTLGKILGIMVPKKQVKIIV